MNAHGFRPPHHRHEHSPAPQQEPQQELNTTVQWAPPAASLDALEPFDSATQMAPEWGNDEAAQDLTSPAISPPPPGFHAAVGVAGAGVFAALWALSHLVGPGVVAAGAAAITVAQPVRVLLRMRSVGEKLCWRIRNEDDLAAARGVAEMDMKAAVILMARLWSVPLFCLASGEILSALALIPLLLLGGPWASRIEHRFRDMEVHDDRLSTRFQRICKAWKEPRWKLPPDV